MTTKTATTIAWVTKHSLQTFSRAIQSGDANRLIHCLAFSNNEGMGTGVDAWTKVGSAEITVTFKGENDLVQNAVEALRAQQKAVIAEAQMQATQIERQIQTLLAITHQPA